ncbi:MAG: bile acid:sodium symporter, partial [Syntrophales bacterium]|nr:bile acid:sodium symporter [Syntrophales bacterium]
MKKYLIKYWFFIGIAVVVFLAFQAPIVGIKIKEWRLLGIGIFLAFFINGLELQTKSMIEEMKNIRGLASAVLSSLFFFPVL